MPSTTGQGPGGGGPSWLAFIGHARECLWSVDLFRCESSPFVERLIGSLRRELLDRVFFWNAVDLERKLWSFQLYFNDSRTHASLDGNRPAERSGSVVTHPGAAAQFHLGKALLGAFSNSRSPREYEFATDRSGAAGNHSRIAIRVTIRRPGMRRSRPLHWTAAQIVAGASRLLPW